MGHGLWVFDSTFVQYRRPKDLSNVLRKDELSCGIQT
jgi:hypothetical protein